MRILIITTTLDMSVSWGSTPAFLQLFKSMYEEGAELTVVPWSGKATDSLWWDSLPNPSDREAHIPRGSQYIARKLLGNQFTRSITSLGLKNVLSTRAGRIGDAWAPFLKHLLTGDSPDAVLIIGIPLNDVIQLPGVIHQELGCPVVYYLTEYETVTHFGETDRVSPPPEDISAFDAVITGSLGSVPRLKEMGAKRVDVVYFGLDPTAYVPLQLEKDIGVFFYGHGSNGREEQIEYMIGGPSKEMQTDKFVVGGRGIDRALVGEANLEGMISYSLMRTYICRSKICLSITRKALANEIAASNVRLFELAALGACVVSDPRLGIEEWFKPNVELLVVHSLTESLEVYKWLLGSPDTRLEFGFKARDRFLSEHTSVHRARQVLEVISRLKQ